MNASSNKNLAHHDNSNFYNLTIANSGGDIDATLDIDIDGDLTINSGADLDIGGGNANIELAGSFTNNGNFTTSGEMITFDGSGDITSSAVSDASMDIIINKSSNGSVEFSGTCLFDEFTISNGKASITNNTITCDNTVTISNGAELEIETGTFNADGSFNANSSGTIDFTGNGKLVLSGLVNSLGSLDDANGTVEYDGGTQNILSDNYYNLEIDQSGIKTAQGNIDVENDFTIQSGAIFNVATNQIEVTATSDINGTLKLSTGSFDANGLFDASGGSIDFTDQGDLLLSSIVNSLGALDDAKGTITYDGGIQNVIADSYYNLEVDKSGDKTALGNINVNGDFKITSSSSFQLSSYDLTVEGTSDIENDFSMSTGLYDANGPFNVAINGSYTFLGSGQLNIGNTLVSLRNFTPNSSLVVFDGNSIQNIPSFNMVFYDLKIDGAGLSSNYSFNVDGTLFLGNGDLNMSPNKKVILKSSTSGGSNSGHVVGEIEYISNSNNVCTLDVGDGSNWRPCKIEPINSSSTFEVELKVGNPGTDINNATGIDYVNFDYHYVIDGNSDAYISLPLFGFNKDISPADFTLAKYELSGWKK